jgi:hypothetical protein
MTLVGLSDPKGVVTAHQQPLANEAYRNSTRYPSSE